MHVKKTVELDQKPQIGAGEHQKAHIMLHVYMGGRWLPCTLQAPHYMDMVTNHAEV